MFAFLRAVKRPKSSEDKVSRAAMMMAVIITILKRSTIALEKRDVDPSGLCPK